MNYLKMLQEIDELVNNDFCLDMELKRIPTIQKYTQEEAIEMADIIGQVYMRSHAIHCKSCGEKYKV